MRAIPYQPNGSVKMVASFPDERLRLGLASLRGLALFSRLR